MDSKSELLESALSSSTPTTTADANNLSTTSSSTNNSSTDSSDLLASWTVVNNKENNKSKDENHVEVLKKDSDSEENDEDFDARLADDQPSKNKHLYFNELYGAYQEIRSPRYSYEGGSDSVSDNVSDSVSVISESESLEDRLNKQFMFVSDENISNNSLTNATKSVLKFSYSMTKRGLSCALYVAIGVALLGILGHIFNTSWQQFPAVVKYFPAIDQLEQRINEMELQNNLMRAEIDLLNKQVKHLSTVNDHQQKIQAKGGKYFKVWPGNGDTLTPIDITKQDLKKPYKCGDGSYVERMVECMAPKSVHDPSLLVDELADALENLKYESEAFSTFEQVAEELHGSTDDSTADSNLHPTHTHYKNEYKSNNEYTKFSGKDNSHERKKQKFGRRGSSETHDYDNSYELHEKRMKSREQLRNKNKSDEDDDDDNDNDSGEWHDNYMKHRDQQRKKNEYKSNSYERHGMKNGEKQRKPTEQKIQYKKIYA